MFGTTYLSVDFNLGNPITQYISAGAPTVNQVTQIGVTGGPTNSAATNALVSTIASAGSATWSRIVDFSPVPVLLKYVFDLTVACTTASLLVDENTLPDILPVWADAINAEKLIAAHMIMRLPNTSFLIHANYKTFK